MNSIIKKITSTRELSSLFFLIALFLIVGIINPSFLTFSNISSSIYGSSMYILMSIGIAFVIMTGEIDVSIGATLGLCSTICGTLIRNGSNLFVTIAITVLVGAFVGLINGIGVAKIKMPSIIMTLGTMGVIRGFIYVYTEGKWIENLPTSFKSLSQQSAFFAINLFFMLCIVLAILVHLYLTRTKSGNYFKAIGDNIGGATLIGIPVFRTQVSAFVICGIFTALAAIIFTIRTGFVAPTAGMNYEMTAIAACVLGGISLTGGVGTVLGSTIGAIIMSSLSKLLVFLKFSSDLNDTITGVLLITIVVLDAVSQKRMSEKARRQRLSARAASAGEF